MAETLKQKERAIDLENWQFMKAVLDHHNGWTLKPLALERMVMWSGLRIEMCQIFMKDTLKLTNVAEEIKRSKPRLKEAALESCFKNRR